MLSVCLQHLKVYNSVFQLKNKHFIGDPLMRLKQYIFGLLAMLAMATSIQPPLLAAQNHHSSSSSSQKDDKFCKKANKLLKQIDQTTMQDLVVDRNYP